MPNVKKISPRKYAKMAIGGLDALMDRKRDQNPELYTKYINDSLKALLKENNKRKKSKVNSSE